MPPSQDRLAVLFHRGEYEQLHQGLSAAVAATAVGRPVQLFFFYWALERLALDRLGEPEFDPPRPDVADRFEARGLPTCRALVDALRQSGLATFYACSGSLPALGLDLAQVRGAVDQVVGWSSILELTRGGDRLQF